jgi:hypothetical protein
VRVRGRGAPDRAVEHAADDVRAVDGFGGAVAGDLGDIEVYENPDPVAAAARASGTKPPGRRRRWSMTLAFVSDSDTNERQKDAMALLR